jgi:DNA helicase-2/ATP-dependent DNA helicase PcrA
MSAGEPGGPAEERRLFYVGITRARRRLYLSLAMTRAQFGDINVAMPSRYLQEIPPELIDWRQSPGMANSRGGTQPRALNVRRPSVGSDNNFGSGGFSSSGSGGFSSGGSGYGFSDRGPSATALARAAKNADKPKTEWANKVTASVRDNGDLKLAVGDRIRHVDFGDGRVSAVTDNGAKSVAEVQFDKAGRKRLLVKIAPIEKL